MRKIAPCLIAVASRLACDPVCAEPISVSAALGFESRYVFRGVQYAQTSLQPAVTLTKDGLHLGAWFNLPVDDDDGVVPPNGEELDLVAGYSAPLGDMATLDFGVTYYVFPEAMNGFGDFYEEDGDGLGINTIEPYVSLAFNAPLSPTIVLYRDLMYDTLTLQGTFAQSVGLADKTNLEVSCMIGYVVDDAIGTDYLYGVASAGLAYLLNEKSRVYAGARYGDSDLAGGSLFDGAIVGAKKSDGFWLGVGLSSAF